MTIQLFIITLDREQFRMRPFLDDHTVTHDDNPVSLRQIADIDAVDPNAALLHIVEPAQQADE